MVSEKDLQSYLKVAASALPCREARKEFSSYVHNVAHDISIENPDADFATVASLLGTTPKQVAADFVESQSPQTISRWNRSAHRYKYGLQLLVGIIVVVESFPMYSNSTQFQRRNFIKKLLLRDSLIKSNTASV